MNAPERIWVEHPHKFGEDVEYVRADIEALREAAAQHGYTLTPKMGNKTARADINAELLDVSPRAAEMLAIAAKIIREHASDAMAHYDEADCDGYCVAEDCEAIADDLLEAIARVKGGTQ